MTNMSNKVAEISDPTHHTSLMTSLRQFITTESFVDVQFICQGGHKVFAHKLMLISVSRLLKKILTENPNTNEMITIHLPDVNSKLLRIVVNFLYIGYMRLNSVEMDQFKLVLGLLDIELFQKNPEQNCPTEVNVDPLNVPNNVQYVSNSASVGPGVINSSAAVENQMYCQQSSQNEYVPVAQSVTPVVPVGNRPHQYLALHSSGPVVPGTGGMVVQQNVTNVPAAHEIVLQGQNQYSTYVSNVLTSPVTPTQATSNSVPTNLIAVPVSNISQLSAQQISVQAPLSAQIPQIPGQQVRLYPGTQNQTLITKNGPFTSSSESRVIATAQPQLSKGVKRKSPRFVGSQTSKSPVLQDVIDLSDDEDQKPNVDPKLNSIKTAICSRQQKVRQRGHYNNSNAVASISSSSSSLLSSSHTSSPSSTSSSRNERPKKQGREIINIDLGNQ